MNETITIIISSGLISALVTGVTLLITVGTYKEKINAAAASVDKHDTRISSLSDRVSRLEGGVDRDRAHSSKYLESKSPISLTDQGKVVLLDSKGKDYIDSHKKNLIEAIRNKNPKTAYDVQELSHKVIEQTSNDDSFIPIKNYVYNKGEKLNDIVDVLAIYLRDIALPELGFHISDIKD